MNPSDLKFNFGGDLYTPPAQDSIAFEERDRTHVTPYGTNVNFYLPDELYTPPTQTSINFSFGFIEVTPPDSDEDTLPLTSAVYGTRWKGEAKPINVSTAVPWGVTEIFYNVTALDISNRDTALFASFMERADMYINYLYSSTNVVSTAVVAPIQAVTGVVLLRFDGLEIIYTDWEVSSEYEFDEVQANTGSQWLRTIPNDLDYTFNWDEFEKYEAGYRLKFEKTFKPQDIDQTLRWGYGLNNFIVGGSTNIPSNPEDGLVEPPDGEIIEHINYEVYRVVNIVNIKVAGTNNTIQFDNFSIQTDIESFAWTVTFDVLDKASFELIRPVGRTLKTIDIEINNETFTLVVAKGSIQRRQGKVVYRCSGWSRTKLLADPYAAKRSYKDTQARTAAQIVDMELTGTGFNYTWSTVDWQVPVGVHSYQDKTPLGAIIALAESVGAVIVPHPSLLQFDIRPHYPVSPWQWDSAGLNRSMNELQFFEISNDPVPKPNPDGVYVYGEDNNGVGVKAVRSGKPGTALLPDVVNKYITDNVAGQERGRVEVSKNCFIDRYTMTTYVDENGIIKPHELVRFTDTDGGTWRGMVLSVKVDCNRVGTALIQTIQVARFYDD